MKKWFMKRPDVDKPSSPPQLNLPLPISLCLSVSPSLHTLRRTQTEEAKARVQSCSGMKGIFCRRGLRLWGVRSSATVRVCLPVCECVHVCGSEWVKASPGWQRADKGKGIRGDRMKRERNRRGVLTVCSLEEPNITGSEDADVQQLLPTTAAGTQAPCTSS